MRRNISLFLGAATFLTSLSASAQPRRFSIYVEYAYSIQNCVTPTCKKQACIDANRAFEISAKKQCDELGGTLSIEKLAIASQFANGAETQWICNVATPESGGVECIIDL